MDHEKVTKLFKYVKASAKGRKQGQSYLKDQKKVTKLFKDMKASAKSDRRAKGILKISKTSKVV